MSNSDSETDSMIRNHIARIKAKKKNQTDKSVEKPVEEKKEVPVETKETPKKERKPKEPRKQKDPSAPKRPLNAYQQFCKDTMASLGKEIPAKDRMKKCAELWRAKKGQTKP